MRLRHDLIIAETVELKMHTTQVRMTASGSLRTCGVHMVREVSRGLYHISKHFQGHGQYHMVNALPGAKSNLLRQLPSWVIELHLTGSNFSVDLAGVDNQISKQTRGLTIGLKS